MADDKYNAVKLQSNQEDSYNRIFDTLGTAPDWNRMPSRYQLSHANINLLEALCCPSKSFTERYQILHNVDCFRLVLQLFLNYHQADPGSTGDRVGYLLLLLHEIIREDAYRITQLLELNIERLTIHESLFQVLKKIPKAIYADCATRVATDFIAHDPNCRTQNVIEHLVGSLIDRVTKATVVGILAGLANLLKIAKYRVHLWNMAGVHILIRANLNPTRSDPVSNYHACFCSWLFTFEAKYISHMTESGLLSRIIHILKTTPRKEKVIRLAVQIIDNCIDNEDALQNMIELNLGDTLDILEFEKWRANELYEMIQKTASRYHEAIKAYSTFDRYIHELDSGSLNWGYLHSEQFWDENVMSFENDEFRQIRKLLTLLRSVDATTLAVACHDIGEFGRLHPLGKQKLSGLHAKPMLLSLMDHRDRTVQRESLLAIQKIMLDNWKLE